MKFMWDHLSKNIGVDDIAREAGVSRRKLERAFREDLGRGINHELLRRRLERRDVRRVTAEIRLRLVTADGRLRELVTGTGPAQGTGAGGKDVLPPPLL